MPRIDDIFRVHRAVSDLFEEYEPGDVAYVTNSSDANGVSGFVEPRPGDAVFEFTGIVVSSFSRVQGSCGARVQSPPFIACGRSGNGVLVLEAKRSMTPGELAYYAAYINRAHGWRFTWYRQATRDRFAGLAIPEAPVNADFDVSQRMPERRKPSIVRRRLQLHPIHLDTLFVLRPGDYHAESDLDLGSTPLVSCGAENNGVVGFFDVPPDDIYRNRLTISLNGRPLTAKYHPYAFAAKDDVAIAIPREPFRLTTMLFVQAALNRERWRYSYYRKCYLDKLRRFQIALPMLAGRLAEDEMAEVVTATPYWRFLEVRLGVPDSLRNN